MIFWPTFCWKPLYHSCCEKYFVTPTTYYIIEDLQDQKVFTNSGGLFLQGNAPWHTANLYRQHVNSTIVQDTKFFRSQSFWALIGCAGPTCLLCRISIIAAVNILALRVQSACLSKSCFVGIGLQTFRFQIVDVGNENLSFVFDII